MPRDRTRPCNTQTAFDQRKSSYIVIVMLIPRKRSSHQAVSVPTVVVFGTLVLINNVKYAKKYPYFPSILMGRFLP